MSFEHTRGGHVSVPLWLWVAMQQPLSEAASLLQVPVTFVVRVGDFGRVAIVISSKRM